jgi:2-polyprenyl-6-methoxyphenol hydroxylase-like FAD-dependent oxidoreductase
MQTLAEPSMARTPVLVVGAGPVGAVLALELARQQTSVLVLDSSVTASSHPKMDYLNARSMELLSRLGVAEQIRARGVAPQHPFNFIWSRDFNEAPIAIWDYASVGELTSRIASCTDGSLPSQAHQRMQGSLIEEILRAQLRAEPLVDFREGWSFDGLTQDRGGVTVSVTEQVSGRSHRVRASYLVGCDGAASAVRRAVGIGVSQLGPTTRHRDVYFRSNDPVLRRHGRAFLTIAAGGLTLVSRDEKDTWTGTVHLADQSAAESDPVGLMRRNLGVDFRVDEVLSVVEWDGRLGVADSYRSGRVMIAGDAAHQFYPTGGHGANTGIGDAVDLGWKLSAVIHGWGGPRLLGSYEQERRPVGLFNREMCGNLLEVWLRFPRLVAAGASREHLAGFLACEQHQMDNLGIHFGYRYDTSPVVWPEQDQQAPPWKWGSMPSVSWPGGLLPAAVLASGEWLSDRFGAGFTLLDLSGEHAGKDLAETALAEGVPVTYLDVDEATIRSRYGRNLILIRPDGHVCWHADLAPAEWPAVLARVTGR